MGMQGNLRDMAIADLIQHTCQDRKTAQLRVEHSGQQAILYFDKGNVVHASLGDQAGEEVIYAILRWEEGKFDLEGGVMPPERTIKQSWSGLLLEGARRLDETGISFFQSEPETYLEANEMAQKFEDILKELGGEVNGYLASTLTGMDGINLASHTKAKVDPEAVSAQMAMLIKLVHTSVEKLGAGEIEDNLTTTDNAYLLIRFLPGKQYYLGIAADRKNGNLGNMRLISKMYVDRLAKAMPR